MTSSLHAKGAGCRWGVRLNRGKKDGGGKILPPEYFVFPVDVVRSAHQPGGWSKVYFKDILDLERYRENWSLIAEFLIGRAGKMDSSSTTDRKRPLPTYNLTLHKTYYEQGFFNLGVEVERFVRKNDGPITLRLAASQSSLVARASRRWNRNGAPRILGGPELRNWFQREFRLKDIVLVEIISPTEQRLLKPR